MTVLVCPDCRGFEDRSGERCSMCSDPGCWSEICDCTVFERFNQGCDCTETCGRCGAECDDDGSCWRCDDDA